MNEQVNVSLFPRLFKVDNQVTTFEELIILIIKRRWRREIVAYRAALAAGKAEEARQLKGRLPGFTPSGVFRGGHRAEQLERYSGLVGLDFDHVADLSAMQAAFREMPATYAFFVSPGGEGLKVFVRVDSEPSRHREAYLRVAAVYEQASGQLSDPKCKDLSRCCYVSDDEAAYYNPDADVFRIPEATAKPPTAAEAFVASFLARSPAAEGNRNQTVYRLGCEANRRGFALGEITLCCASLLQSPGFSVQEMDQALRSAYQGNTGEFAASAARLGQLRTVRTLYARDTADDASPEPEKEEGEALREQTPCLPDWVVGLLPPLLQEATGFYSLQRERDMALLGACTVLSACLPGVWGRYNRKRLYPHLFTVEVAPAGSGKGCINDMRRLADRYAKLVEVETQRAEQEYLQALEEWELKKQEAHRKHQPIRVADAPVPVATVYLNVPVHITKAKLLVHLRDNGEVGGLMADSEIDTLVAATKQEYGMFDDLLRKSFHHETVASSRKTDNELIRVECPRIALLLAGTPGQFIRLIPDVGSGLHSRLLLYTCRSKAVWQDVSPEGAGQDMEAQLGELSERVLQLAMVLRQKSLQVCLTAKQWHALNQHYENQLREADLFGDQEFLSVVKRYGLITFRLCMVFTALRCGSEGYGMEMQYCTDDHFRAALAITQTCLEHSRLLLTQVRRDKELPELTFPLRQRRLLEALPDAFSLPEAYICGQQEEMEERAVRRFLKKLNPQYIKRIDRGRYQKTPECAELTV